MKIYNKLLLTLCLLVKQFDLSVKWEVYEADIVNIIKKEAETTFIKSKTDSQKTQTVIKYIKEQKIKNVIYLTNRISFADSLLTTLNQNGLGFKKYGKEKIDSGRWIVQSESLNKINFIPELLVLDETVSLISQLHSPYHNTLFEDNIHTWCNLINKAKQVVCMDADLHDERVLDTIASYRKDKVIQYQYNKKQRKGLKAFELSEDDLFVKMLTDLKEGKKIFFCSGSKEITNNLQEIIYNTFGHDFRAVTYNSDKGCEYFTNIDVNKEWSEMSYVGITSSISNGIDFHESHFDAIYLYASSMTNCVREYKQMINRVRKTKDNSLYFHINNQSSSFPTNRDKIKEYVETKLKYRSIIINNSIQDAKTQHMFDNLNLNNLKLYVGQDIINDKIERHINWNEYIPRMFLLDLEEKFKDRNNFSKNLKAMLVATGYDTITSYGPLDKSNYVLFSQACIDGILSLHHKRYTTFIQTATNPPLPEIVDNLELKSLHNQLNTSEKLLLKNVFAIKQFTKGSAQKIKKSTLIALGADFLGLAKSRRWISRQEPMVNSSLKDLTKLNKTHSTNLLNTDCDLIALGNSLISLISKDNETLHLKNIPFVKSHILKNTQRWNSTIGMGYRCPSPLAKDYLWVSHLNKYLNHIFGVRFLKNKNLSTPTNSVYKLTPHAWITDLEPMVKPISFNFDKFDDSLKYSVPPSEKLLYWHSDSESDTEVSNKNKNTTASNPIRLTKPKKSDASNITISPSGDSSPPLIPKLKLLTRKKVISN